MRLRGLIGFVSVFSSVCCVLALNTGVAFACEPSYWDTDADPRLPCLTLREVTGGIELRNGCEEPIEVTPEECDEPCSETLRIAVNAAKRLELLDAAETPSEDVEHVFAYKQADQTGTLTISYFSNPCTEEGGDCSAAPLRGQRTPPVSTWLALIAPAALLALRRRARRSR